MVDFPVSSFEIPDIRKLSLNNFQAINSHKDGYAPWVGHTELLPLRNGTKTFDDRSISSFTHTDVLHSELIFETIQYLRLLVGLFGWMTHEPRGLYVAKTHHRKIRHTSMTAERFELAFPVLSWSNTVSAFDRAVTVLVGYGAISRQLAHSGEW
jgi:hypothetical protein